MSRRPVPVDHHPCGPIVPYRGGDGIHGGAVAVAGQHAEHVGLAALAHHPRLFPFGGIAVHQRALLRPRRAAAQQFPRLFHQPVLHQAAADSPVQLAALGHQQLRPAVPGEPRVLSATHATNTRSPRSRQPPTCSQNPLISVHLMIADPTTSDTSTRSHPSNAFACCKLRCGGARCQFNRVASVKLAVCAAQSIQASLEVAPAWDSPECRPRKSLLQVGRS